MTWKTFFTILLFLFFPCVSALADGKTARKLHPDDDNLWEPLRVEYLNGPSYGDVKRLREQHYKRYGAAGGIICNDGKGGKTRIASATLTEDCQFITTKNGVFYDESGKQKWFANGCRFLYNDIDKKGRLVPTEVGLDFSTIYRRKSCQGAVGGILGVALKACVARMPVAKINTKLVHMGKLAGKNIEFLPYIQGDMSGEKRNSEFYVRGKISKLSGETTFSCGATSATYLAPTTGGASGSGIFVHNKKDAQYYDQPSMIGVQYAAADRPNLSRSGRFTIFYRKDKKEIAKIIKKLRDRREKKLP